MGPISTLVTHMHSVGASKAAVECAVADMEAAIYELMRGGDSTVENEMVASSYSAKNETVAQQNETLAPKNETLGQNETVYMRPWADADKLAEKHDPMLLKAVLEGAPGLSRATRAVGLELAARYNQKTGRCDPSIVGIVKRAGVSRASAFRAVARLEARGLFFKKRCGGNNHRNQYTPNWPHLVVLLDEIAAREKADKTANERSHFVAQRSHSRCQNETQTQKNNITKFNTSGEIPREGDVEHSTALKPAGSPKQRNKPHDRRQQSMLLPIAGGQADRSGFHDQSPSSLPTSQEAGEKAQQRIWKAFHERFKGTVHHARLMVAFSAEPEAWALAIAQEKRKWGTGLVALLEALDAPKANGTGPP